SDQSVAWLEQIGFRVSGCDQSDFTSRAAASSRRADSFPGTPSSPCAASSLREDSISPALREDSVSPSDPAPRAGLSPRLLVVGRANNEGFGAASNSGVRAATSRLVLLLNNDVEIAGDAVGKLVENFADESVFAAHCRVIDGRTGAECGIGKIGSFARG